MATYVGSPTVVSYLSPTCPPLLLVPRLFLVATCASLGYYDFGQHCITNICAESNRLQHVQICLVDHWRLRNIYSMIHEADDGQARRSGVPFKDSQ